MQDGSNKHRPGYDLTFSAPKSVSMMAMLGGDKRLIDAHNQAVDFAVRQVEALASTRVMTDGQSETVLTGNLVMALFNHDTSRDQEPDVVSCWKAWPSRRAVPLSSTRRKTLPERDVNPAGWCRTS